MYIFIVYQNKTFQIDILSESIENVPFCLIDQRSAVNKPPKHSEEVSLYLVSVELTFLVGT